MRFALVALGLVAIFGCTVEDELDPEPETELELELDQWCAPSEPQALALADRGGIAVIGACGHVAVASDESILISPDGDISPLPDLQSTPVFAPTGQLGVWSQVPLELGLHALYTDDERTLVGPFEGYGFVRSTAPGVGSRLWTCADVLITRTLDEDEDVNLGAADCLSVVAARNRPRLAYANLDGQIRLADADTGTTDSIAGGFTLQPEPSDGLRIDHDGEVIVHDVYGVVNNQFVPVKSRLHTAAGEELAELDGDAVMLQATKPGSPVFFRGADGELVVVDEGTLSALGDVGPLAVSEAGDLVAATLDGPVVRFDHAAPGVAVDLGSPAVPPATMAISTGGEWAAWTGTAAGCIDEFCDHLLVRTERWSRETGTSVALETAGETKLLAVFDNGAILLQGTRAITTSAPISFMLINVDGKVALQLDPTYTQVSVIHQVLPDGRALLLLERETSDLDRLVLLDPNTGQLSELLMDNDIQSVTLDGYAQRVAVNLFDMSAPWFGGL